MTRALLPTSYSTNPVSEITSAVVGLVEFLELDLPTGNLFLTNAPRAYTWGGNTYTPFSTTGTPYGSMIGYSESTDSVPRPMTLTLSGADKTFVGNLVGNNIQWCKAVWSLGLIDASENLINSTPMFSTPQYIGSCTITLGKNTANITIECENLLADMQSRYSGMLQTVQDQQQRFANDTFYSFCESLPFQWIYWNQSKPFTIGSFGNGGGPSTMPNNKHHTAEV